MTEYVLVGPGPRLLARRFTESSVVRVVGAMLGTASLVNPSESPAAASEPSHTPREGRARCLVLAARWVSESKLRGLRWLASCGRLSAAPGDDWLTESGR